MKRLGVLVLAVAVFAPWAVLLFASGFAWWKVAMFAGISIAQCAAMMLSGWLLADKPAKGGTESAPPAKVLPTFAPGDRQWEASS